MAFINDYFATLLLILSTSDFPRKDTKMDEMTRLFSPSCWVPGKTRDEVMDEFFSGITEAYNLAMSDEKLLKELDIPYGSEENQKIDIYGKVTEKLFIFFHGGYWVEGTRKHCLTPIPCAIANGYAFASVGYGLAINGRTLSDCVNDAVKAVAFLLEKYPNVRKVVVGGHSAGAHLAFQATVHNNNPRIQSLVLFAGCYFLQDLVGTEIGNDINLTKEEADLTSCNLTELEGISTKPFVFIGDLEAPKLIEQNKEFADKVKSTTLWNLIGSGHYTIMTNLLSKESAEYKALESSL